MDYLYILFLILPLVLIVVLFTNRQSLVPGLLLILNIINLGLLILHLYYQHQSIIKENTILRYLAIFFYVGLILSLIIFPIFLILNFFYNGIQIIKREGFSFKNLLSIMAPLFVLVYAYFWQMFGSKLYHSLTSIVYNYLGMIIVYFLLISTAYFFSSAFNMIYPKSKGLEYIMVLGSGLDGDKLTPLLKGRVDKALEVYRKNPGSKLLMSGGQGPDELVPEGLAMADYAMGMGVPASDIIIEDKSRNTRENILYSMKKIEKRKPKLAIVSNNYHIFRALLLAKDLGVKAFGYGKTTKRYFAINAFIREIIGYFVMDRKKHILILSILSVVYLFLVIVLNIVYKNNLVF